MTQPAASVQGPGQRRRLGAAATVVVLGAALVIGWLLLFGGEDPPDRAVPGPSPSTRASGPQLSSSSGPTAASEPASTSATSTASPLRWSVLGDWASTVDTDQQWYVFAFIVRNFGPTAALEVALEVSSTSASAVTAVVFVPADLSRIAKPQLDPAPSRTIPAGSSATVMLRVQPDCSAPAPQLSVLLRYRVGTSPDLLTTELRPPALSDATASPIAQLDDRACGRVTSTPAP